MRLAFIDDNGDTVELETAIRRQPYAVRGLLTDAIFFCQREVLSDSLDFFKAEHAIRDALENFNGDQEKFVRGYVLSRILDERVKETPRAYLISSAFKYGGPLAVIGVFYATLNVKRTQRSRETLEYLVHESSIESKIELLKRAKTFPCNPSIAPWLSRILDNLDINTQALACLLRCLGTHNIPRSIFDLSQQSSKTWNADGEVVELPPRLASVVTDTSLCMIALSELELVGLITTTPESISLETRVSELLCDRLESQLRRAEAVNIISHVFPKHSGIDAERYLPQCELFLPQLRWVCSCFDDASMISLCAQAPYRFQLVEALLSSSELGGYRWKIKSLSLAENLLLAVETRDTLTVETLRARVKVRQASISHAYSDGCSTAQIACPLFDHRSNAFSADLALLRAKSHINYNVLQSAIETLRSFNPGLHGKVSTLERLQQNRIDTCRARIYLLEGQFHMAHDILLASRNRGGVRVAICLAEALCELGRCSEAEAVLESQLPILKEDSRQSRRVRLALTNVQLFQCMKQIKQSRNDWRSLHNIQLSFEKLQDKTRPLTLSGKLNKLSILAGLAVVAHLHKEIELAMKCWRAFLAYSNEFLPLGFTDMIASYSMGELELRLGHVLDSQILRTKAESIFKRTGRQYHFLGLGSIWFDIVGSLYETHNQARIL
ncbi:hypothetical protein F5B19DRAFT_480643 [Rostrohypoxylon terebratum]|nr:hypothetical protein F5B19DRAFT_480643 [Rostrohypoxylon terebratum]